MASVFDVAEYVLAKAGPMSAMKLQKLVYYSQAWHSVWSDEALFSSPIQAWANGPVVPVLYERHRGQFILVKGTIKHNPGELSVDEKDSVDSVLAAYGDKTSQWLSDLTHMEEPWKTARKGVPDGDRCANEITLAAMNEYYASI